MISSQDNIWGGPDGNREEAAEVHRERAVGGVEFFFSFERIKRSENMGPAGQLQTRTQALAQCKSYKQGADGTSHQHRPESPEKIYSLILAS